MNGMCQGLESHTSSPLSNTTQEQSQACEESDSGDAVVATWGHAEVRRLWWEPISGDWNQQPTWSSLCLEPTVWGVLGLAELWDSLPGSLT